MRGRIEEVVTLRGEMRGNMREKRGKTKGERDAKEGY